MDRCCPAPAWRRSTFASAIREWRCRLQPRWSPGLGHAPDWSRGRDGVAEAALLVCAVRNSEVISCNPLEAAAGSKVTTSALWPAHSHVCDQDGTGAVGALVGAAQPPRVSSGDELPGAFALQESSPTELPLRLTWTNSCPRTSTGGMSSFFSSLENRDLSLRAGRSGSSRTIPPQRATVHRSVLERC